MKKLNRAKVLVYLKIAGTCRDQISGQVNFEIWEQVSEATHSSVNVFKGTVYDFIARNINKEAK